MIVWLETQIHIYYILDDISHTNTTNTTHMSNLIIQYFTKHNIHSNWVNTGKVS